MEYYTADSYKGYERIGEPYYNKTGKLATKARCKCDRCVKGVYVSRIENGMPVPHPAYNGICLACGGTGIIEKEIRLYTKAEYDAMQRTKERTAEKREAAMLAGAEKKRSNWLESNGFDAEGYTYILVGINSYAIKDELKEAGWKYNSFIRWHNAEAGDYAENAVKVHWSEFYSTTAWGDMYPLPDAQKKADTMIKGDEEKEELPSEWIGEVGERLKDLPVTLVGVYGFNGRYGYSQVVKFITEEGNVLTWFTAVNIPIASGEKCLLSGTIKKHDQYKDQKTTIVTRCKMV